MCVEKLQAKRVNSPSKNPNSGREVPSTAQVVSEPELGNGNMLKVCTWKITAHATLSLAPIQKLSTSRLPSFSQKAGCLFSGGMKHNVMTWYP